jgi:hypothetical protein
MERVKKINSNELHALASTLVARHAFSQALGMKSYGGDRDVSLALGYKDKLVYADFTSRYFRQDIAKAIIDRPIKATWQGELCVVESGTNEETELEKAWDDLNESLSLKSIFARADKCSGLGKYGVLLLGLDDVSTNEQFAEPVTAGKRKLLYVKPFGEGSAQIQTYDNNPKSKRYGRPLLYSITTQETEGGDSQVILVHFSRVLHIVDDILESEVEGNPRLEVVFNRLMDLEKLIGGDAEMYWRGARPGYTGTVDKDFQMSAPLKEDLKNQIQEYEHNLRRFLLSEGVDIKALTQQLSDPINHVDVQIQMISAVTGIPKRVLVGSERGELSSAQDTVEWKVYVQSRREDYAELRIVRPFLNKMIELGVLPAPRSKGKYSIKWSDLFAISEADRVKIGLDRSNAIKNYASSPMAEMVMTPDVFLEVGLGLTDDEIEYIGQKMSSASAQEQISQAQQLLAPAPKPLPAGNPAQPMRRLPKTGK